MGGEPTLHPQVLEFARLSREYCKDVRIYSNACAESSRLILEELARMGIHNSGGTEKPSGSIAHGNNVYIDPCDFGHCRTIACTWSAYQGCGFSVDALGITPCAIGGMIDGIRRLNARTWDLEALNEERLHRLCRHCGSYWPYEVKPRDEDLIS